MRSVTVSAPQRRRSSTCTCASPDTRRTSLPCHRKTASHTQRLSSRFTMLGHTNPAARGPLALPPAPRATESLACGAMAAGRRTRQARPTQADWPADRTGVRANLDQAARALARIRARLPHPHAALGSQSAPSPVSPVGADRSAP